VAGWSDSKGSVGATTPPVVAMAVSFPGSKSGIKVEYTVNNVEWESWQATYGSPE